MNDTIRDFLVETTENLAQMDLDLLAMEKGPTDKETLARVFRTIHTIKGSAGFLAFSRLEALTHAGESLLGRLRDGRLKISPEIVGALLLLVDAVRQMLVPIEATELEGATEFPALIERLQQLQVAEKAISDAPNPTKVSSQARNVSAEGAASGTSTNGAAADSSIRVDVGLLDKLMNLVGELVLSRNQIMQFTATIEDPAFIATSQHLNLITTELQEGVMRTRMQPIGNIWSKFPRLVRDLAVSCGKQVLIEMEGKGTELDKTIIEAIRDPLTHLVRNAVDHGIETPAQRQAAGKPSDGRLFLRAFHEGGKVNIEMRDDGAGIDLDRVRAKGIENKLITPEQAARLSERELLNLILLPGFSTTDKVTHVSGRGVGMDVVRTNIERIGGTVDIASKRGQGFTVKMKIPLTLAIIPALTITSGGDRYAIPQVSLLELVRLEGEQAGRAIEQIHGSPVYRLRGNLLPLIYLNQELAVGNATGPETGEGNAVNIVVLQADERQFGLVVESIHDTEEIVVKPLQKQLKGISAFAGATIMGDGKVALILDVLGLAQRAHVVSGVRERGLTEKTAPQAEKQQQTQTLLLCETHTGGRMAIPLSMVARLEEFPRESIEKVGREDVVQYRDEILPLLHVDRVLRTRTRSPKVSNGRNGAANGKHDTHEQTPATAEKVQVVVFSGHGRRVGLVIGRILDIVEDAVVTRSAANRVGILYSAVVQGRVTEFLDVEALIGANERGRGVSAAPVSVGR